MQMKREYELLLWINREIKKISHQNPIGHSKI